MRVWLVIVAGGLVTYFTRASFILAGDRLTLPENVQRSLRYVAPASFAAITVPAVLGGDGFSDLRSDVPRVIAALVAGAIIYRTRSVPFSLLAGIAVLWMLQWAGL